ncbi:uncharacterized protein LOC142776173 [Rhipicephalus microplus]|uniref:uncharacterized protein LOC142776173 n=1 Tax=Rhipicephalus microplus TaxID=6941 RepID=UPI003F6B9947
MKFRSSLRLRGHSGTMTENRAPASAPGVPEAEDVVVALGPLQIVAHLAAPAIPAHEVDVEVSLSEYERRTGVRTVLRRSFDQGNGTTLACEQKRGKENFFKPGTLIVALAPASPSLVSERVHGPFS